MPTQGSWRPLVEISTSSPAWLIERRAYNPRCIADDERHLLGRAERRRDEKIAFVLAIVVVGDRDDLAAGEGGNGGFNAMMYVLHENLSLPALGKAKAIRQRPSDRGDADSDRR